MAVCHLGGKHSPEHRDGEIRPDDRRVIRKLGFKPEDIKIIINGHGHSDHAGAFAYMKKISGAQIAIMQPDVPMIEDGGKSDFYYGKDWQIMGQPPVMLDRILRDGDTVRLGEVMLTGYNTPGHTKGATAYLPARTPERKEFLGLKERSGFFQDMQNTPIFMQNAPVHCCRSREVVP